MKIYMLLHFQVKETVTFKIHLSQSYKKDNKNKTSKSRGQDQF